MHKYRRQAKFAAWYDDPEDEQNGIPIKNPFRKYKAPSGSSAIKYEDPDGGPLQHVVTDEVGYHPKVPVNDLPHQIHSHTATYPTSTEVRKANDAAVDIPRSDSPIQEDRVQLPSPIHPLDCASVVATGSDNSDTISKPKTLLRRLKFGDLDFYKRHDKKEEEEEIEPLRHSLVFTFLHPFIALASSKSLLKQRLWPKEDLPRRAENALKAANDTYKVRWDAHSKIFLASLLLDSLDSKAAVSRVEIIDARQSEILQDAAYVRLIHRPTRALADDRSMANALGSGSCMFCATP
jgi:hypothetical protein